MAKGKYAVRAENRREDALATQLAEARAELERERTQYSQRVQEMKTELASLRGEIMREASRLADSEIAKRTAEVMKERDLVRTSLNVFEGIEYRQDKFIMNACRYFSMTEGVSPADALNRVWTWYTEEDCYGTFADPLLLAAMGLPSDGWVARTVSYMILPRTSARQRQQRIRDDRPIAITLDHAEEQEDDRIHPGYKRWKQYYQVEHNASVVLTGEGEHAGKVIK